MKRILSLLLTSAIIGMVALSCTSNEKKAEKLIKDYMFKNLHDYSSYEPVETKIDTAFANPIFDTELVALALSASNYFEAAKDATDEAEYASTSLDIWRSSYSSYGKSEYKKAREKLGDCLQKYVDNMDKFFEIAENIKEKASEIDEKEVVGWMVSHKFRSNNRAGNKVLGDYGFLMDKKFTKIINSFDFDDEEIGEAVDMLLEIIHSDTITDRSSVDSMRKQLEKLKGN